MSCLTTLPLNGIFVSKEGVYILQGLQFSRGSGYDF